MYPILYACVSYSTKLLTPKACYYSLQTVAMTPTISCLCLALVEDFPCTQLVPHLFIQNPTDPSPSWVSTTILWPPSLSRQALLLGSFKGAR